MEELYARRLVPVLVVDDVAHAPLLGDALVAGGLPVAEVTLRSPAALDVVAALAGRGDLLVGAGTVLDVDQVGRAADAGARFVVSPGLDEAVVAATLERGMTPLPGVATPSEAMAARRLGITTVKFFPAAELGGPATLRAWSAALPGMSFVPTGGIGPADLGEYLSLACAAAVGGSWLAPRDVLAAGDNEEISRRCRAALAQVEAIAQEGMR